MTVKEVKEVSLNRETTLSLLDSKLWVNKTKRKELDKSRKKMDGTNTSSLFHSTINKFILP